MEKQDSNLHVVLTTAASKAAPMPLGDSPIFKELIKEFLLFLWQLLDSNQCRPRPKRGGNILTSLNRHKTKNLTTFDCEACLLYFIYMLLFTFYLLL